MNVFPVPTPKRKKTQWLRRVGYWIFCPDSRIGWVPFAFWKGWRIISREKIDAVMVIGEPFSSFLTGVFLKALTRKPLLLDFRDEWVPLNRYRAPGKPSLVLKVEKRLESFVVRHADRVTSVTPAIINHFKKRYPAFAEKFSWIPNGFDPDEYPAVKKSLTKNGKWTITYAGSLYKGRSPLYFFEALEKLVEEIPPLAEQLRFIFLGNAEPSVEAYFRRPLIEKVTERPGFVPYAQMVEILCRSHLLLTIGEEEETIASRYVPGKLLEYLGTGCYILALGGEGCMKEIIESARAGRVVPARDVTKIKETLKELFGAYQRRDPQVEPDRKTVALYRCDHMVRKLSSLLDGMVPVSRGGFHCD